MKKSSSEALTVLNKAVGKVEIVIEGKAHEKPVLQQTLKTYNQKKFLTW